MVNVAVVLQTNHCMVIVFVFDSISGSEDTNFWKESKVVLPNCNAINSHSTTVL